MRIIPLALIGLGFSLLALLALPATGDTWASNPTRFFLGADVYPEREVIGMREGHVLQLSDSTRPASPKEFAERIIRLGTPTDAKGPESIRYYVVPRLHPKLELFIPALCILGIGVLWSTAISEKKNGA